MSGFSGPASRTKIIPITRVLNAANATVAYTGAGFQPIGLRAAGMVAGSISQHIVLFAEADSARAAVCTYLGGTVLNTSTNYFLFFQDSTSVNGATAVVSAYGNDGFSLDWVLFGAPGAVTASIGVVCVAP